MKKYLLALMIALLGCVTAMAGDKMELIEGSLEPLKEGGTAIIKINMDSCLFDNNKPLREDSRYADVDKYIPEYESEFIREFNEHSNKFRMATDENADYSFAIDVNNMDCYVKVVTIKPGVGTKIWGKLTISKGEKRIAIIKLNSFENSGFTYNLGLEETYENIAKALAKRINKGK